MSDISDSLIHSDYFPAATKLEIKRLAGTSCWACHSPMSQIAQVFDQEDKQIEYWNRAGLINFSLESFDNGIPLCPNCHTQFDRSDDPGFVFLPVDLKYFIDFELQDRDRRAAAERDEAVTRREVPTNAMYLEHLVREGLAPEGSSQGLHQRVFLKHYFLAGPVDLEIWTSATQRLAWCADGDSTPSIPSPGKYPYMRA
ncbi:hypothetical protein BDV18DRAFT_155908 [Aspergillus unguis]